MPKRTPTRPGQRGEGRVSTRRKAGPRPAAKKAATDPAALLVAFQERVRNRFGRQADDIWGVVLPVVAVLIGLAFIRHRPPRVGRVIVAGLTLLVGVWAYVVPIALGCSGCSSSPADAVTTTGGSPPGCCSPSSAHWASSI